MAELIMESTAATTLRWNLCNSNAYHNKVSSVCGYSEWCYNYWL